MATIRITRVAGNVEFKPNPATVRTGEPVVFSNEDPQAQHLIQRVEPDAVWFQHPLAPFVREPADTSDQLIFTRAETVTYGCSLAGHTDGKGTIVVVK